MIISRLEKESNLIELRTGVQLCSEDDFVLIQAQRKIPESAEASHGRHNYTSESKNGAHGNSNGQRYRGLSRNGRKWQVSNTPK